MSAITNPTNLTPPRVQFIDPRTGAISREWYRFFLSLLTATQNNQTEIELAPDAASLLSSYEAMLADLAQATDSTISPVTADDLAVVQTQTQNLEVSLPPSDQSYLASIQSELQGLGLEPRAELGTIAAKNTGATGSFTAGAVTVTVVDGIITSIV
jgi:hypothetical protein